MINSTDCPHEGDETISGAFLFDYGAGDEDPFLALRYDILILCSPQTTVRCHVHKQFQFCLGCGQTVQPALKIDPQNRNECDYVTAITKVRSFANFRTGVLIPGKE